MVEEIHTHALYTLITFFLSRHCEGLGPHYSVNKDRVMAIGFLFFIFRYCSFALLLPSKARETNISYSPPTCLWCTCLLYCFIICNTLCTSVWLVLLLVSLAVLSAYFTNSCQDLSSFSSPRIHSRQRNVPL